MRLSSAAALASIALLACSDGQATATANETPTVPAPGIGTVDSILPAAVALERFVAGLPKTSVLEGGAATPAALVSRFLNSLNQRDTAAIAGMVISRAEYGFLYYPSSIYSVKPYKLPPDVAWMLSSQSSAKGAARLLDRLGGKNVTLRDFKCEKIDHEGSNRIQSNCTVTYATVSGVIERRGLFQSIIERDGIAKFLSYSGDF